jgi:hypothetical protein
MAIDPPVKTKVTVDPDTGARVFNQSWSSEIKKKEPIVRKPVSRDTFVTEKKAVVKSAAKPVAKESVEKTSGERKFSEVVVPKPAPAKVMELKGNNDIAKMAPRKVKTAEQLRVENIRFSNKIAQEDKREEQKKIAIKQYPNKTPEKALEKFDNVRYREYKKEKRQQKKGEREVERDWQSRLGGSGSKSSKKYGCPGGCN